ncbi:MAG: hypothetical protein VXU48_05455 [Verrucomicrobiota bacterium]|nr:hypothetical protein [Verrucomicrobiota bacterium]
MSRIWGEVEFVAASGGGGDQLQDHRPVTSCQDVKLVLMDARHGGHSGQSLL